MWPEPDGEHAEHREEESNLRLGTEMDVVIIEDGM